MFCELKIVGKVSFILHKRLVKFLQFSNIREVQGSPEPKMPIFCSLATFKDFCVKF